MDLSCHLVPAHPSVTQADSSPPVPSLLALPASWPKFVSMTCLLGPEVGEVLSRSPRSAVWRAVACPCCPLWALETPWSPCVSMEWGLVPVSRLWPSLSFWFCLPPVCVVWPHCLDLQCVNLATISPWEVANQREPTDLLETNLTCNISASWIFPKTLGGTIYILTFARDPHPLPLRHIGDSGITPQHSGVTKQVVSGPSLSVWRGEAWSLCCTLTREGMGGICRLGR